MAKLKPARGPKMAALLISCFAAVAMVLTAQSQSGPGANASSKAASASPAASAPAAPAAASGKTAWPPTGPVPRGPDGHPDLSGAWAPNAIRQNVDLVGTGVKVPFQPWAEKVYKERKESQAKEDPEARCLPPGVPRMSTTPYPFRIAQTPGLILIVYEGGAHVWRQIFTDGRPHQADPNPSWLGDSIGHWEGDVLGGGYHRFQRQSMDR